MLSTYATKLLAWLNIYKISATSYDYKLTNYAPKSQRRGIFKDALAELVSYGY